MKKTLVIAVLAFSGCEHKASPPMPIETVLVVYLQKESIYAGRYTVLPRTVVQFPDGTRRSKTGVWGCVGDEFSASVDPRLSDEWATPFPTPNLTK